MNCLVVDDELIFRAAMKEMIGLDFSLNLIGECTDAATAYNEISNQKVDLLFLDAKLPGICWLKLASILEDKPTMVILMKSEPQHETEIYNLSVVDYLIKPIVLPQFLKAISKAKELYSNQQSFARKNNNSEFIFIRDSYTIRKLKISDILYLEAKDNYVSIFLSDKTYSIHSSIKCVEQRLPLDIFIRVHRSFIVNINRIDTMEGRILVLNKNMVPVSDTYRADLIRRMHIL